MIPSTSYRTAAALFFAVLLSTVSLHGQSSKSETPKPLAEREIAWSKHAPLTLPAAELLAWGQGEEVGTDDVVVLLNETTAVFDAAGRATTTHRFIYRTRTQASADQWAPVEAYWSPWYEERPQIDGRVVSADGVEHRLDPKTIDDAPVADADSALFSDRRRLRAPLPGVGPGAVVEQVIVTREKEPMFDAGVAHGFPASRYVPVRISRLEITAPAEVPVAVKTYNLDVTPVRDTADGSVKTLYEVGPFAADENFEGNTPGEVRQNRSISYTTGTSWKAVAARYDAIAAEKIGASDLKALVKGTIGKETDRQQIIARLVHRLHHDVRYTGLEFGEGSIVPSTPSETLHRRFGDCKDKSTVLVAMLRAAGIPASLALLSTGPGRDIDPDLPGFGWFDHAIVYVPGDQPMWIDATDELGDVGTLPPGSQGRLALVASPETTGLIKTAESESADNRVIQERAFQLAELGKAKAVESVRVSGSLARRYRSGYDGFDEKDARSNIERYAKNIYLSEKVTDFRHGDPRDTSTPFTLRIEMAEAGRGETDLNEAVVVIFPGNFTDWLPSELTTADAENAPKRPERKNDFVFSEPFVAEWDYRVTAPVGFRARPLPESKKVPLGTASMTMEYYRESDEVVTARYVLDSGKRRLTPSEYRDLRTAVLDFQKTEATILGFDQIGQALLSAGKVREALDQFRNLETQHPKEALHHAQVALALLEAGLGEAARREIDRAVKLEPQSAIAYQIRGWVYEHDLLGRRFKKGFDLAEAVAAYRKAKEIDPDNVVVRANLAILLEFDAKGGRYKDPSNLAQAIGEYQKLHDDLKNDGYQHNLAIALMQAGRFQELSDLAEKSPGLENRQEFLLVAAISKEGSEATARLAAKIVPDAAQRRTVLSNVGETFVLLRRYPQAVAAFMEAAKGSPDAARIHARADAFSKVTRREELALSDDDPATVAKKMFAATLAADSSPDDLIPLLTTAAAAEVRDPLIHKRMEEIVPLLRRRLGDPGSDPQVLIDFFLGTMRASVDGDDSIGYRIGLRAAGPEGTLDESYFVVRENGSYRVASFYGDPFGAGLEAQRLLDQGNLAAARKWLDWAREDVPDRKGDDPLAGNPFLLFWKKGEEGGAQEIGDAAAVLTVACSKPVADKAIAHLRASSQNAKTDEERAKYETAIALGLAGARNGEQLAEVGKQLLQAAPDSQTAFLYRVGGLALLRRHDEVKALASARLEKDPQGWMAMRILSNAQAELGDGPGSLDTCRKLIDSGRAEAGDYNNCAWYTVSADRVDQTALEDAQQAVNLRPGIAGFLHTLATLYAEQGKTAEAKAAIWAAMDANGTETPRSYDWYVLGRIAEQHGIPEEAILSYKKVTKDIDTGDDGPVSTWALAQRRLMVLKEGPGGERR